MRSKGGLNLTSGTTILKTPPKGWAPKTTSSESQWSLESTRLYQNAINKFKKQKICSDQFSFDRHLKANCDPPQGLGRKQTLCSPFHLSFLCSVQSLSHALLFATEWTAACQASLSITTSQSLFKLMFIESVMPSNHLIFYPPTH